MTVRAAGPDDLPALTDIYNHYVEHTHVTFDTESFSPERRQPWFDQFDGDRYRCLVAEDNDQILGYATSNRFKPKPAYQTSVEVGVYLDVERLGRGTGTALYEVLLSQLAATDLHRAYAGIALPNDASLALHAAFGFKQVARFAEVGHKFDRYWDVVWLERPLPG